MKPSVILVALAMLLNSDRATPSDCDSFEDEFHVDANSARKGSVTMDNALIEFDSAGDALNLTVRDRRSGSVIILELPMVIEPDAESLRD